MEIYGKQVFALIDTSAGSFRVDIRGDVEYYRDEDGAWYPADRCRCEFLDPADVILIRHLGFQLLTGKK